MYMANFAFLFAVFPKLHYPGQLFKQLIQLLKGIDGYLVLQCSERKLKPEIQLIKDKTHLLEHLHT